VVGSDERERIEGNVGWEENWWGRLVFRLFLTQISSFSGHGIHLYL
jgi:hypothetical protein